MASVEELDRLAANTITDLYATVRAIRVNACNHDGIALDSLFAVFSEDNPHVPFLDNTQKRLNEAISNQRNVGYVGLDLRVVGIPKRPRTKKTAKKAQS